MSKGKRLTKCARCDKRLRNRVSAVADDWGLRLVDGRWPADLVCPSCLSDSEYGEMVVGGATMVASRLGRLVPKP